MCNYQGMINVMGNKQMKVRHGKRHSKIQTNANVRSSWLPRWGSGMELLESSFLHPVESLKPSKVARTNIEASPMK